MQVLLSAYSESKAYNPKEPDADLIAMHGIRRDKVGVVRMICVKERSSAKRKEIFQKIQLQAKVNHPPRERPLQLLLDMPVRWSSTYLMLERADHLKDDVDSFIHEIAAAERDRECRQKLMNLQLMDDEWLRIVGEQTVRYSFTTLTTLATLHFLFRTRCAVTRTPLVFSPSSLIPRRLEVSHFIATLF